MLRARMERCVRVSLRLGDNPAVAKLLDSRAAESEHLSEALVDALPVTLDEIVRQTRAAIVWLCG